MRAIDRKLLRDLAQLCGQVADLLSSDAARVREGAPATLTRWGGAPLTARVTRVHPSEDGARVRPR